MNRRVPLATRTPLRSRTPMPARVAGLNPRRRRHVATNTPVERTSRDEWEALRDLTWARCGGWCEKCGAKLNPTWWEWSHRLAEGQGGPADIRNGLAMHPLSCHREGPRSVHKAPERAWLDGYVVRSGEDFRTRPVLIGGARWALLTAAGGYEWLADGDAA